MVQFVDASSYDPTRQFEIGQLITVLAAQVLGLAEYTVHRRRAPEVTHLPLTQRHDQMTTVTIFERRVTQPPLPNKPSDVSRDDDRRVLNGSCSDWVRCGAICRGAMGHIQLNSTVWRWTKADVYDRIMDGMTDILCG